MNTTIKNFFLLLQYAVGNRADCPRMKLEEWQQMYTICQQQALSAFVGHALIKAEGVIDETDADRRREFTRLIMRWTAELLQYQAANKKVDEDAVGVAAQLSKAGFETCLLKGQGNALLYPTPSARTPGDIDAWVRLKSAGPYDMQESERQAIAFARKMDPKTKVQYHHADCPPYKGTSVELHYRPQFLYILRYNKRLQQFFVDHADEQFRHTVQLGKGEIAVPTAPFNIVFQLCHIFNHLFQEGIGLRQLTDYYYQLLHLTDEERQRDWPQIFGRLGLRSIAGAVMWILVNCFGMDPAKCIVPPEERRGRFVLQEIMSGGNFGQYSDREHYEQGTMGWNLQRLGRDVRLLKYFPLESLSEPLYRVWHYIWRRRH